MSTSLKGLVASLAFATSFTAAAAPASANTLELLGLDSYPDQCDLRLTRAALSLDLDIPENLSGVTDVFCGCEVVSIQMLEFIRRHRHLEVLLDTTSTQCGGFANVLANVTTATTGDEDGRTPGRRNDNDNGTGSNTDGGDKDGDGGDKGGDGGDKGGDGGDKGGDKGGDNSTDGGDNGTDGGDNGTDGGDNGTDGRDEGTDGGDNGTDGGDKGTDGGDKGTDGGDKGTDGGDKGGRDDHHHDHDYDHGRGDKGDRGDRDDHRGGDHHDKDC